MRGRELGVALAAAAHGTDSLTILPPIDVFKCRDRYWVVDGHDRVALALYGGQKAVDANVVELIPLGERRTSRSARWRRRSPHRVQSAGRQRPAPSLELSRKTPEHGSPDDGGDG